MYSTKEVEEKTGIPASTLRLWVREGFLSPQTFGDGTGKRMQWTDNDVADAVTFKNGQSILKYFKDAQEARAGNNSGDIVVTGEKGTKAFPSDAPICDAVRRAGRVCVLIA